MSIIEDIINRRKFLRGFGRLAVNLPILNIMLNSNGTAFANGTEFAKKLIVIHTGLPPGTGKNSGFNPNVNFTTHSFKPKQYGINYTPTKELLPIKNNGLTNNVSIVGGLFIPYLSGAGSIDAYNLSVNKCESGDKAKCAASDAHNQLRRTMMCGKGALQKNQTSFDQLILNQVKGKHLNVSTFNSGSANVTSIKNNKLLGASNLIGGFNSVFTGGGGKTGVQVTEADKAKIVHELSRKGNILDLIMDDIKDVNKKLGAEDKRKLASFLDIYEQRGKDLLTEINYAGSVASAPQVTCSNTKPTNPSSSGTNYIKDATPRYMDLMSTAISCGSASVATFSYKNSHWYPGDGKPWGVTSARSGNHIHGAIHEGADVAPLQTWFVDMYARVIKSLKDVKVGAGTSLDNTVVVMTTEGLGKHIATNPTKAESDHKQIIPHSSSNIVVFVGTGENNQNLKMGQHIDGKGRYPSQALNSVMESFGVTGGLGDIKGNISEFKS